MTSQVVLPEIIAAIEAPTTRVTRRVEIFESDGITTWEKPGSESRVIDGNVSVDYTRDERRALDLTLDNRDQLLQTDERTGLWYDKIIKVYRGIEFDVTKTQPHILIIYDNQNRMRTELRNLGFNAVFTNTSASTLADLIGYDIIVVDAYQSAIPSPKATLLGQAYAAGYHIFTCSNDGDETTIPFVTASIAKTVGTNWAMSPAPGDNPLLGGWGTVSSFGSTEAGRLPTTLAATATSVAVMTFSSTLGSVAAINTNTDGIRWFHLGIAEREANTRRMIQNGFNWLFSYQSRGEYETPIGTFMIDRIDEEYFPRTVKITGRDYTKKLMLSKIGSGLTFVAGTDISSLIRAVGANAGLTSFSVDTAGASLLADVSFEKSTSRWEIIKTICTSYQFEVFFDPFGTLVVRQFLDPLTSPTSLRLITGTESNLVSYAKSINDSRIFNHVTVTSDNQDQLAVGVLIFGEAFNNEPTSPTNIGRLGQRTYPVTSSVINNNDQAVALAETWLQVVALEEYNLSFESLVYPWLEAGQILEFIDPRKSATDPDRFLFDTFTIPIVLGGMTGTGKRVTIIGSGSTPGEPLFSEASA